MDKRWRIPAIVSGLCNFGLVLSLGLMGLLKVPVTTTSAPVEVSLIHEETGLQGGGGPQISTPQTQKIDIPPPIANSEDATAILEQVKAEVAQQQTTPTAVPSVGVTTTSTEGSGLAGGIGDGQGQGTGAGMGEGSGSGSGDEGLGAGDDGVIVDKGSLTLLNDVEASYPPKLLRQGKTGSVTVQLIVEKDGTVSSVEVISSSGYTEFDRAVTSVAYQWTFVPATENGRPVRAYARRTYTFAL